jgi:hypothetical protein
LLNFYFAKLDEKNAESNLADTMAEGRWPFFFSFLFFSPKNVFCHLNKTKKVFCQPCCSSCRVMTVLQILLSEKERNFVRKSNKMQMANSM